MGGMLVPKKPVYIAVMFAVGSYPPVSDLGPVPVGVWPLALMWEVLRGDIYGTSWHTLFVALTSVALGAMFIAYVPVVFLGSILRRRLLK